MYNIMKDGDRLEVDVYYNVNSVDILMVVVVVVTAEGAENRMR